jgi:hypothetical protein
LRLASLYDSRWDFTLYGEGFMALIGDSTRYISVDALINQAPLDPDYISVKDFVLKKQAAGSFGKDKITPPVLIKMLERDCRKALRLVKGIDTQNNVSLLYEVADAQTWAYLGLHFAEKLKGALALQTFRTKGGQENQHQAVAHLQKALGYWDEVIQITRPLYKDMPLTHYNGSSHDRNDHNLFHWALIRPEVAKDVEIAKNATFQVSKQ